MSEVLSGPEQSRMGSRRMDQATRARLRECYTQAEPPPCPVCGEARIKRFDQTADRRWECWAPDPPGIDMRDHMARGIWLEPTPDIDVIAALDALERIEQEADELREERTKLLAVIHTAGTDNIEIANRGWQAEQERDEWKADSHLREQNFQAAAQERDTLQLRVEQAEQDRDAAQQAYERMFDIQHVTYLKLARLAAMVTAHVEQGHDFAGELAAALAEIDAPRPLPDGQLSWRSPYHQAWLEERAIAREVLADNHRLTIERDSIEQERDKVRGLLAELIDQEDCCFDLNGMCQAHAVIGHGTCPHHDAKNILAKVTPP